MIVGVDLLRNSSEAPWCLGDKYLVSYNCQILIIYEFNGIILLVR